MSAMVAAAVFGPVVGAVTAYNAWAFYLACKNRYFTTPAKRVPRSGSGLSVLS